MKTYDLYGIRVESLEDARRLVERVLEIEFVPHESGYRCGLYYRLGNVGDEHFILQSNHNDFEREWTESQYKSYPFLLYVNETRRSVEIQSLFSQFSEIILLNQQSFED